MARTSPITTGTDLTGPASRGPAGGRPPEVAASRGAAGGRPPEVAASRGAAGGRPPEVALSSDITDPGLALAGQPGIAWAQRAMPVLGMLRASFAERQPFAGL